MRSSSGLHLHSHTCVCTHRNTHTVKDTPPIPQAAAVHWSPALLVGVSTQGTLSSRNWIIRISFCSFFLLRCPWGFLFVLFCGKPLLKPRLLGTCNIDQAGLNFQLVVHRPHHPKSWDCRRALPYLAGFHFYCHLCFFTNFNISKIFYSGHHYFFLVMEIWVVASI